MEVLIEQITLANKNRFGRSSEKMTDTSQICFIEVDGTIVFFNEAEAVSDLDAEEPDTLENKPARKAKVVGKKEADIKDLPVNIINHYLTDEELVAEFGENGWKQLPDAISKHYRFIPAKVEIDEHHVGVYTSKTDDRIIKADHPKALLHGSLVSPTIAAAIMNGKYVNAVPLYRLEQELINSLLSGVIFLLLAIKIFTNASLYYISYIFLLSFSFVHFYSIYCHLKPRIKFIFQNS